MNHHPPAIGRGLKPVCRAVRHAVKSSFPPDHVCTKLHMPRYNPALIEPKWQTFWEQNATFAAPRLPSGEKLYVLDMFPYPSGDGLHVGHPEGYTATDIVCRFERMRGKSVLHPMGFDAFGLPAEEHAIRTGTPPRIGTERNIDNFRRQLKMLGFSYDWSRELATTDTEYFRWTQWIFLQLFDTWYDPVAKKGRPISELPIPADVQAAGKAAVGRYQDEHRLAYQSEAPVNWCPALGTVLANEEVIGGVSERGGHPVVRIPLRQWMLRITAYADRLEQDLEQVDWPENIKKSQRDWIGRSTGAEVDFSIAAESANGVLLRIYTTRPDTLFGATYMVIAPEHPLVGRLTTAENAARVKEYCDKAATKSDLDRTELAKTKTGVFTGSYATNPANGEPVPIWIADYVLVSYGTGAIMAVPAHDERDFEFAKTFGLPIVPVVDPGDKNPAEREALLNGERAFTGEGTAINSGPYTGLPTAEFKTAITADLAKRGVGRAAVNYKLRDWLFSRQRFWGEPFPILHELDAAGKPTGVYRTVPPEQLPVNLPELEDFKPHGRPEPPLEKAPRIVVVRHARRPALQARNEYDAAMGRLLLVLSAVHRPYERTCADRSRIGTGLDAGRSVHRRSRTCRVALALRTVLAQGALRSRTCEHPRTIPKVSEPGNDSRRDGVHRLSQGERRMAERRSGEERRGRPPDR